MHTPSLNTVIKQKNYKYACINNKHAQNYTKYALNGAFTNGTSPPHTYKMKHKLSKTKLNKRL